MGVTVEQPSQKPVPTDVVAIPKVTFNYIVIAVTFLLVGILMGAVGYDRFSQANTEENALLIRQAVAAALNEGGGTAAAQPRLDPNQRYEVPVADAPSRGQETAPVTIIEFGDFRCGFCGRFARETLEPLLAQYGENVRFVYRDFIIFGQASYEAALASECANDQGEYWAFHDRAFANQQALSRDLYLQWADELALDIDQFTTCYDDELRRDQVVADTDFATTLGLTGTPTFFINGRVVSGAQPLEAFKQIIDAELASSDTSQTGA